MSSSTLVGFEMMHPYSELAITAVKKIETRHFGLPAEYIGVPFVLLETQPGTDPRLSESLTAIGKVKFTSSFKYNTREEWLQDCDKHGVEPDNERFGFKEDVPKFGWDVEVLERWTEKVPVGSGARLHPSLESVWTLPAPADT